jgi:hypothetical protein
MSPKLNLQLPPPLSQPSLMHMVLKNWMLIQVWLMLKLVRTTQLGWSMNLSHHLLLGLHPT